MPSTTTVLSFHIILAVRSSSDRHCVPCSVHPGDPLAILPQSFHGRVCRVRVKTPPGLAHPLVQDKSCPRFKRYKSLFRARSPRVYFLCFIIYPGCVDHVWLDCMAAIPHRLSIQRSFQYHPTLKRRPSQFSSSCAFPIDTGPPTSNSKFPFIAFDRLRLPLCAIPNG